MIKAVRRLLALDTAGDPMTGLKWTHRTPEKISEQLKQIGIDVSPKTVARLMKKIGYALRVNHKKKSTVKSALRNQQFEYIKAMRQTFQAAKLPTVSVDTKKKEMLGNFKSVGAAYSTQAWAANDHDFKRDSTGNALPRGNYDQVANRVPLRARAACAARKIRSEL